MREKLIELLWEYDQMRMMRMSIEECVDHLIANGVTFCDEVEELKATVVHQRKRADTAETFICTMCSECDYEVNDGILTMQKRCCSSFPECEKFKLRPGWIPVTERLPEERMAVLCIGSKGGMFISNCWRISNTAPGGKIWINGQGWRTFTHWMPLPTPPKEEPKC